MKITPMRWPMVNRTAARACATVFALVCGCSSGGGDRTDSTRAASTVAPAADAERAESTHVARPLLGQWQAFSRVASDQMGDLELTGSEVVFSKGYRFTYHPSGRFLALDAPSGPQAAVAAAICGNSAPLSMTASVDSSETPPMLRLAFFSVKTGPDATHDLDRGLCSKVSYSRR